MKQDILDILISQDALHEKVAALGKQISADYTGKKLLMVGVLKGSTVFMADLMRAVDIPCEIDFISVSSYGAGAVTSGKVKMIKDLTKDLQEWELLLVEDILDSGITLTHLKEMMISRGAKSVKICTLLDKPEGRRVPITPDYFGFTVPDHFLVGYGLDYNEKYRNLPYVGILKEEVYNK